MGGNLGDGLGLEPRLPVTAREVYRFREEMVSLALTLAGFGIFVAVILGFRFAMPIQSLAVVAKQIGGAYGEFAASIVETNLIEG